MSSRDTVLSTVRKYLGRSVRLPSGVSWDVELNSSGTTLALQVSCDILSRNLQTNQAAAPFFMICFAYWYERATSQHCSTRLELTGAPPTSGGALQHFRRSMIALEAAQEALGERLTINGPSCVTWPTQPTFNKPLSKRSNREGDKKGSEHDLETQLCREAQIAHSFSSHFEPITTFRRQLPLGLFEGEISKKTMWTPGGGAQADLWSTSPDGTTFHLFELKVMGSKLVGVLPELLTYLWLVHRTRVGFNGQPPISGGGEGLTAARSAKFLKGWIMAPNVHPLIRMNGSGPLDWFNQGLAHHGITIAFSDYALDSSGLIEWRT